MRDPAYRSTRRLVKWMTVLLMAEAVLCLAGLWSSCHQVARIDTAQTEYEKTLARLDEELARLDEELGGAETRSWVDAYVIPGGTIDLAQAGVALALIILFCNWIPCANRNARALGATGLRFTPGWSVGWYFVPVMNLFRPYQAMKEIWMASVPSDATDRQQRAPSSLLGSWWALWLVSGASGLLVLWLTPAGWDEVRLAAWASLYSNAVDIPLAIVAMLVVWRIHGMQERRRAATAVE